MASLAVCGALCAIVEGRTSRAWVSAALRQHAIFGLEVMSSVGDELRVAWMIDRFYADDLSHQRWLMLVNVLHELGLRIGRSRDEHRAGIGDRLRDSLKEIVILGGVPASDRVRLMMDVPGRVIRMQHEPLHIGGTEVEHPSFVVIDPNDRMEVMRGHGADPCNGSMMLETCS